MKPKIIAGNWKMYQSQADLSDFAKALEAKLASSSFSKNILPLICPQFISISKAVDLFGPLNIAIGGQDCHEKISGAYTGNVSASLLKETGADYVILGHSERRQYQKESSELVAKKAKTALDNGLKPIICVGESLEEREAGRAESVVAAQLDLSLPNDFAEGDIVIAYEPVWAIGTGKTASIEDVKAMHDYIKQKTKGQFPILYGGSVKPENAKEILAIDSVGGVLVGGASLKADSFYEIVTAYK